MSPRPPWTWERRQSIWLVEETSSKVRFTVSQSFILNRHTLDIIPSLNEGLPDFPAGILILGEQDLYWAWVQFCVLWNTWGANENEKIRRDWDGHWYTLPCVFAVVSEQVLGRGWPFSAMSLGTGCGLQGWVKCVTASGNVLPDTLPSDAHERGLLRAFQKTY